MIEMLAGRTASAFCLGEDFIRLRSPGVTVIYRGLGLLVFPGHTIGGGTARMIAVLYDGDERQEYSSCICGCGQDSQRRFHPGCDPGFYKRLRLFADAGDFEAAALYEFMYKNNRKVTYAEQHWRARRWLGRVQWRVSVAAD